MLSGMLAPAWVRGFALINDAGFTSAHRAPHPQLSDRPRFAENLRFERTPRWREGYSNWRFHDEFMAAKKLRESAHSWVVELEQGQGRISFAFNSAVADDDILH
jgi:hypothetical protein